MILDTRGAAGEAAGRRLNERPGALDDCGTLRQRSSPTYQTRDSVVNRKGGSSPALVEEDERLIALSALIAPLRRNNAAPDARELPRPVVTMLAHRTGGNWGYPCGHEIGNLLKDG